MNDDSQEAQGLSNTRKCVYTEIVCRKDTLQFGLGCLFPPRKFLVHVVDLFPKRPRGLHTLDLETIDMLEFCRVRWYGKGGGGRQDRFGGGVKGFTHVGVKSSLSTVKGSISI